MNFANKVVLITGGCSGIGEATALAFTNKGATVVIVDKDDKNDANIVEKCEKLGEKPTILHTDLTNDTAMRDMVETVINSYGKLDILVNCAGILREGKLLDDDFISQFDEVMNVNLRALALLTHLTAPHLIKTKGNVINISSIAALIVPKFTLPAYCVSKAAVNHFTKAAAKELGPLGVRVNSVNPGFVKTNLYKNGYCIIDYENSCTQTPLGRVSEPCEVADLIVFLASDVAKSITGAHYVIDSGISLAR